MLETYRNLLRETSKSVFRKDMVNLTVHSPLPMATLSFTECSLVRCLVYNCIPACHIYTWFALHTDIIKNQNTFDKNTLNVWCNKYFIFADVQVLILFHWMRDAYSQYVTLKCTFICNLWICTALCFKKFRCSFNRSINYKSEHTDDESQNRLHWLIGASFI